MSQPWEKLISTENGALADCLSLSRVSISRATGDVRVRFSGRRGCCPRGEYKFVAQQMASAFPQVRVETKVSYPALRACVERDLSVASALMKRNLCATKARVRCRLSTGTARVGGSRTAG